MTRNDRAKYLHALLSQYARTTDLRIVAHVLHPDDPFPAPAITDYTIVDDHVSVIVPHHAQLEPLPVKHHVSWQVTKQLAEEVVRLLQAKHDEECAQQ